MYIGKCACTSNTQLCKGALDTHFLKLLSFNRRDASGTLVKLC